MVLVQMTDERYHHATGGTRSAEFWIAWSFWITDGEPLGNQARVACIRDKRFADNKDSFLLLSPAGASKGLEDVDTGGGSGEYSSHVRREGEMGDESNTQPAEAQFQRHQVAVHGDASKNARLFSLSEKGRSLILEQIWLNPVHPPTLQHLIHGQ